MQTTDNKEEIKTLRKQGKYLWQYKHIKFQGGGGGREWGNADPVYFVFDSKQDFDVWFRETQIGLASLDQVMNYCEYFVRSKGNQGKYIREGKEHEVNGEWDGYHIEGSSLFPQVHFDYKLMDSFRNFLKENGWGNSWFDLKDKYVKFI